MNESGLFSLALLLAFCSIYFSIIQQGLSNESLLANSAIKAIELEKADFIREEISINFENMLKETLNDAIGAGTKDPFALKSLVAEGIFDFFAKIEMKNSRISCFILDNISNKKEDATKEAISELISVAFVDNFSSMQTAEVSMHAGALKNLEPSCEINFNEAHAFFKIPADYLLEVNIDEP